LKLGMSFNLKINANSFIFFLFDFRPDDD